MLHVYWIGTATIRGDMEGKGLVQIHMESEFQSLDSNPGLSPLQSALHRKMGLMLQDNMGCHMV